MGRIQCNSSIPTCLPHRPWKNRRIFRLSSLHWNCPILHVASPDSLAAYQRLHDWHMTWPEYLSFQQRSTQLQKNPKTKQGADVNQIPEPARPTTCALLVTSYFVYLPDGWNIYFVIITSSVRTLRVRCIIHTCSHLHYYTLHSIVVRRAMYGSIICKLNV